MTRTAVSLGLALFVVGACGGASTHKGAVSGPLEPGDAALFDGGVEYVDDPEQLTGRWREDWQRELAERTRRSDAIFVGAVDSARLGAELDGGRFMDLRVSVREALAGRARGVVELRSRPDDPGYRTLERAGDRLLEEPYVAFVKWVEEGERVRGRFHLVRASRPVVSAVEFELGKR